MNEDTDDRTGVLLAVSAYVLWGLFPLYWRLLDGVPPFEIAAHRILWCAGFVGVLTFWRGRWGRIRRILRTRPLIMALSVSSVLIAANWTIYIYSISSHQVVEAALGYFINPLFSILLGVAFLHERISKVRWAAVALAGAAMALKAASVGHVPLIALGLAVTFGLYGLVRKRTPVDPFDGLFVESGLLFPFVLLFLSSLAVSGVGAMRPGATMTDTLLILGGPVTGIPLALFAAGARRIRLSTLGFVQYFSPTITLSIAVFAFGEAFSAFDLAVFGCIWAALALVAAEGWLKKARS